MTEATRVVNKNFYRMNFCSEHLRRTNLCVYTHERNLNHKILSIYELKKKERDNAKLQVLEQSIP